MIERLTIFYTYHLAPHLDALPRLYSYLQTLQAHYDAPHALLMDLGRCCDEHVWHCQATQGRSTLVVLDGMGYHVANVEGIIAPAQRSQLKRVVTMAMVDERHSWRYDVPPVRDEGILISAMPSPALRLCIVSTPAERTHLEAGVLMLAPAPSGEDAPLQVGVVDVALEPAPSIRHQAFHALPSDVRPHPMIISAVDFMLEEARYHQGRNRP